MLQKTQLSFTCVTILNSLSNSENQIENRIIFLNTKIKICLIFVRNWLCVSQKNSGSSTQSRGVRCSSFLLALLA